VRKLLLLSAIFIFSVLHGVMAQEIRSAEQVIRDSCMACHGSDGNGPVSADFPRIGGQHREYIEKALSDYITGRRKDPTMRAQVVDPATGKALVSDAEIKAVADYLSKQSGVFIK
jgi:cytochrome c553